VVTEAMSSHILWLKYHGVGRITSIARAGQRGHDGGEGLIAALGDGDLIGARIVPP
jgi:hypothetical protein